jgi:hypothetical protein
MNGPEASTVDRPAPSTPVKVWRTVARALLTLFVLGQFLFLVGSNFLGVEEPLRTEFKNFAWGDPPPRDAPSPWQRFKRGVQAAMKDTEPPDYLNGKGDVQEKYYKVARTYTKHWSQLTGQPQSWSLFAPYIVEVIPFPAVEFRWDAQDWPDWAGPPASGEHPTAIVYLSDNEPRPLPDGRPGRLCYAKFGLARIRKYEEQITTPTPPATDGLFLPNTEEWQERVSKKVREDPEAIRNYLRWRTDVYQRAYPDLPRPTQVILLVRAFEVPKPPGPEPWDWYDLGEHRLARWLPPAPLDGEKYQAVERYNPIKECFERVEK